MQDIVIQQVLDIFALRHADQAQHIGLAPALGVPRITDHRIFRADLRDLLGRAIVADDDFTVRIGLRQRRSQCDLEMSRFIAWNQDRSEEHTSELQSLMRISYAVFCLKKKNRNNNTYKYS